MMFARQIVIGALAVGAAFNASAQSICRIFEYAELRDMKRERLEAMYCQYIEDMGTMIKIALDQMRNGNTLASHQSSAASERCAQEADRIENILESKFSTPKPVCRKSAPTVPKEAEAQPSPQFLPNAERLAKRYGCDAPMTTAKEVSRQREVYELNCASGKTEVVSCDGWGACRVITDLK